LPPVGAASMLEVTILDAFNLALRVAGCLYRLCV
jgi:hypothetical protein